MAVWYYSVNGQQIGPVEEPQIRTLAAQGKLKADDLVWREGSPQWVRAAEAGLVAAGPTIPVIPAGGVPVAALADSGALTPVQLSYAAPVIAATVPVIAHDEGPFIKIGKQFSIPGGRWNGVTLASPRAFYLFKGSRQTSGVGYGVYGLAGALLHTAFSSADDTRTCDLTDLPHPIRSAIDPKGKRKKGDVIVLPKEAIRLVKVRPLNNVVNVHLGAEKFGLTRGLFARGKIARFLTDSSWTINQEVNAMAAPIHGHGFGREFHEIGQNGPSKAKRVTYAIIGIAIIILVIALKVMNAMR